MTSIKVLDKGYVQLIGYLGEDEDISKAARVSYHKGTQKSRSDEKLIKFLRDNKHLTPFEMVQIKFQIKLPLFVFAQWVRHRVASYNVRSYRYSECENDFYFPEQSRIQTQDTINRQGSSGEEFTDAEAFNKSLAESSKTAFETYEKYCKAGVSREVARMLLPQNLYTSFVWSINARSLFNFLELRLSKDAQFEIRQYAEAILGIVKQTHPIAFADF